MIYFIQSGTEGPIKIGYAKSSVKNRLMSLQCQASCSEELHILGVIPGTVKDEHEHHYAFHAFRLQGEWFSPDPILLDYINSETSISNCPDCSVRWSCSLESDGPEFSRCPLHSAPM